MAAIPPDTLLPRHAPEPAGGPGLPASGLRARLAALTGEDDLPTLIAAGVAAYVAETMLHEAVGHGGACLASGAHVLKLAPLWMRCSEAPPAMVAAGPLANVLGAFGFWAILRVLPPRRALVGLLLWLSFAFNALVACGYLLVGAATGFGDWPALFAWVSPPVLWRLPGAVLATVLYMGCLTVAARRFRMLAGSGAPARTRLLRRALIPASGAACAACLAEIAGGRPQVMTLLLALGCTLGVGYSLTSIDGALVAPGKDDRDLGPIRRAYGLIAAAAAVLVAFVGVIGPGLALETR